MPSFGLAAPPAAYRKRTRIPNPFIRTRLVVSVTYAALVIQVSFPLYVSKLRQSSQLTRRFYTDSRPGLLFGSGCGWLTKAIQENCAPPQLVFYTIVVEICHRDSCDDAKALSNRTAGPLRLLRVPLNPRPGAAARSPMTKGSSDDCFPSKYTQR